MKEPVQLIPGRWVAGCSGLSIVAVAILLIQARLTIQLAASSTWLFLSGEALLAAVWLAFRTARSRWQRIVRDIAEYVGLFVLICLLGAVASYPAAANSSGFIDPALAHMDRILHFDWVGWYGVVSAHPMLQALGSAAYASIYVTPAILFLYFGYAGQQAEARMFIASFWVAAILTLLLFLRLPAEGPLAFFWRGRIPYMPMSALYQAELIPALRSHTFSQISLGALHGLVCAPSFHTTSAVLYITAAWPVARLRWPVTALNITMLLATPVEGTHYLTDMIGGALVALVAMMLATAGARAIVAGGLFEAKPLPTVRPS